MGMFDRIKDFEMPCPKCKEKLDTFQTKSAECMLHNISFKAVDNFYDHCDNCGTWVEFDRKPFESKAIDDYEMSTRSPHRGD